MKQSIQFDFILPDQIDIYNWAEDDDYFEQIMEEYGEKISSVIKESRMRPMERVAIDIFWAEEDKTRQPLVVSGGGVPLIMRGLVDCGILKSTSWEHIIKSTNHYIQVQGSPYIRVVLDDYKYTDYWKNPIIVR